MSKKNQMRQQLEAGMAVFLSQGGQITKAPAQKKPGKRQPKEKMVEIEIDHLPPALRLKHFGE